jgi:phosphatidylglycerol:prolipoprotein diacylglycerol transferase
VNPTLIRIGEFQISSFGLFLLLAFGVSLLLLSRDARREGIDSNSVIDLALYVIIGGIVGARLAHVLVNLPNYVLEPAKILQIWQDGGLSFYGAVLGGLVVVRFGGRSIGLGRFGDLIAPAVAAGYAVAMIGAFLSGLFNGRETDLPWGVPRLGTLAHPTQIYLMIAAIAMYRVLRAVRAQRAYEGQVFLTFLFLHGFTRLVIEFFLDTEIARPALGPFTAAQILNALVAAFALWLMARHAKSSAAQAPELAVAVAGGPSAGGAGDAGLSAYGAALPEAPRSDSTPAVAAAESPDSRNPHDDAPAR